jgi:hypothetical protein
MAALARQAFTEAWKSFGYTDGGQVSRRDPARRSEERVRKMELYKHFWAASLAALLFSATPAAAQPAAEQSINVAAFGAGTSRQVDVDVYTVPGDSQLIIDYVSFRAKVPVGERVTGALLNLPAAHFVVVNGQGDDGYYDYFAGAQQTRIVIGPGQGITFRIERSHYGSSAYPSVTLAGRLVRVK